MKIKTRMLLAKKRFLKAIAKRKFTTATFTCKNCGCVISIKEELPLTEKPTYYTMKYCSFDYCSECISKHIIEDNDLFYIRKTDFLYHTTYRYAFYDEGTTEFPLYEDVSIHSILYNIQDKERKTRLAKSFQTYIFFEQGV